MNEALSREEELFDAARQIDDPGRRRSFLNTACDGDDALRRRVEKLLNAAPLAEEVFERCFLTARGPADDCPAEEGAKDSRDYIGSYRLGAKIGEGGCGEVYIAEQLQPVRRRVALKIIKLGMDTRAVIARFNAERQALAMMDHPHIAKVFDSGATKAGRPYFVMELVSGIKITEFCDKAELDLSARLQLFMQVCHAVQHAHQKGVVHRDLKPSNILVAWQDGRPTPKVIDFGIAKATEERLADDTIFTADAQIIGTPAYMSPEQADVTRPDIDTRSDIYSLGVLLYELISGRTPFGAQELLEFGIDGLRRKLREKDPPTPSALLASLAAAEAALPARRRRIEPRKLILILRGELDWIAMKALEKDRARRYQTAHGLAMDVQRYLNHEPLAARPPSRLYQFQKLARRNLGVFASAAAIAIALIAGFGTSMWLLGREVQARRRAVMAEQREARLRQESETREQITQAEVLLNEGRTAEADAVVDNVEATEPGSEGSAVLRTLGEWHALEGHWHRAARRFELLTKANQTEGWDLATLDFLERGVSLVEAGDQLHYDKFRQLCFDRWKGTTNVVVAERMLKINLLRPVDPTVAHTLEPWARTAAQPVEDGENTEFRAAWRSVSLALFEYRRGHDAAALAWCEKCLSSQEPNPARVATAEIIRTLALEHTGRLAEARDALAKARTMIEQVFAAELSPGSAKDGFWFDWTLGRILLREALEQAG